MPTKATIVTRLGKGSPLTNTEMDSNLTNLRDQSIGIADDTSTVIDVESGNTLTIAGGTGITTAVSGQTITITSSATGDPITIVGDDSTGTAVDLGETFKIAGTQNITTAVTGDTLTITGPDLTSYITASSSDTLTNKTIDANGTGNSISNLEVADFAGSAIITVSETLAANDSDTALVTAGAIIDYVDAQDGNIASDSLVFTNKTFDANATGNSVTNLEVADFATGVVDTDLTSVSASDDTLASAKSIKTYADTKLSDVVSDTTPQLGGNLDVNTKSIVSTSNGHIVLAPDGTGQVKIDDGNSGLNFANYGTASVLITDTTSSANIGIQHYVQGTAVSGSGNNIQSAVINWDTSGTYTNPSGASNGDLAVYMQYDFTDEQILLLPSGAGAGGLVLDCYGHNGNSYATQQILLGNEVTGTSELFINKKISRYRETVNTLTDDSTADIHIDCRTSTVSTFSLNDNKTFVFTNLDEGRSHTLIITNQGAHTATLQGSDSTAVKFPGGAPTITATAGAIDVITVFYDGTNYLGNIAQNYS